MEQFVLVPLSVYDEKIRPLKKILDIKPRTEEKVPIDPTPIYKSVRISTNSAHFPAYRRIYEQKGSNK